MQPTPTWNKMVDHRQTIISRIRHNPNQWWPAWWLWAITRRCGVQINWMMKLLIFCIILGFCNAFVCDCVTDTDQENSLALEICIISDQTSEPLPTSQLNHVLTTKYKQLYRGCSDVFTQLMIGFVRQKRFFYPHDCTSIFSESINHSIKQRESKARPLGIARQWGPHMRIRFGLLFFVYMINISVTHIIFIVKCCSSNLTQIDSFVPIFIVFWFRSSTLWYRRYYL